MTRSAGLLGRITRAFWLQVALITIASVLGIYSARIVIEENLVQNAILDEADYFWRHYQQDSKFQLPDTRNLTGYFDSAELPAVMRDNMPDGPGFYDFTDAGEQLILHVSRQQQQTLYLVFYRGQVDDLVLYYGLFPLLVVLIILYLTLWFAYRFSHRSITPVARLAEQINQVDFSDDHLSFGLQDPLFGRNEEIRILADAISRLGDRLNAFIARERNFTRDASHEFRSPLTVINVAADMLLLDDRLSPDATRSLNKIKRAVNDMENLTEVFLMLAREDSGALTRSEVDVNQVVREQIERVEFLRDHRDVQINLHEHGRLRVFSSETVIAVLLGNLVRNALLYTDCGHVSIDIDEQQLVVSDSGPGISSADIGKIFRPFHRVGADSASGYGIGLTIVKRLCDRFGWKIDVTSETSQGASFRLVFVDS
jgi:signal transduction histidine kinase